MMQSTAALDEGGTSIPPGVSVLWSERHDRLQACQFTAQLLSAKLLSTHLRLRLHHAVTSSSLICSALGRPCSPDGKCISFARRRLPSRQRVPSRPRWISTTAAVLMCGSTPLSSHPLRFLHMSLPARSPCGCSSSARSMRQEGGGASRAEALISS